MKTDVRAVRVTVNGKQIAAEIPVRLLLVDFLRDHLQLTGTHVGCTFEGVCGACTVHLDGEAVKSCMLLAVQVSGRAITTIEGLASGDTPHPLQKAFQEAHALQCGYCTPGILMNLSDFLKRNPRPTEHDIRMALVGNICRCTGYSHIVEATLRAAKSVNAESTP
jgi:aerobic-type carbon monoxide dehydrogenase small subunit (CoxS/CutS family)